MSEAPFGVPVVPLVYWMSARSSVAGFGWDAGSGAVPTTSSQGTVPRDRLVQCGAGLARLRDRQAQSETRDERHRLGDVDRDEARHGEVGGELLDGLHDLRPHDGVLGAVVLELLAQLARRVERVVLDHDRAEPQDRVERDDVLRAVRQHDRDGIAGLDAEIAESRRGALDLLVQLAVGRRAPEELQRGGIGIVPRGRLDDVDRAIPTTGSRSSGTPSA